jgi:tetratricopeptide (TPR) repeat protein
VVAQILYRLGEAYVRQGDYAQGGDAFQSVLGMVDAAGDIIGGAYARYGLGLVQTQLGELDKAEATLRRAQRMAVEAGEQLLVAQVLLAFGEVYRAASRRPSTG